MYRYGGATVCCAFGLKFGLKRSETCVYVSQLSRNLHFFSVLSKHIFRKPQDPKEFEKATDQTGAKSLVDDLKTADPAAVLQYTL